jgi:pilus assembly protein CpaE
MTITVLVADAKAVSRQEIETLLGRDRNIDVVGDARDGREAVEMARSLRPAVVLLDGSIPGLDAITAVESIGLASPDTGVVVLIEGADHDLMRRLMRAGARDCLVKPVAPEDLVSTVTSVHQTMLKQREGHTQTTAPAPAARSHIIAVYSPQGGSGKSMLASNLAVALAKSTGATANKGKVCLIDLNLQFGDIDLMLNLNPENTIAGLAQKGHGGLDAELVEQYLTVHEESGLRILVAPSTPQYAESITVYIVEQILTVLRNSYQIIIVDTPSQLRDTTLAALDAATTIVLLTTLDLLALHKTRVALETLRQLYPGEKIQVVLNRANSEVGISVQDVEASLGMPMRAQIPSDGRIVVTSVNEGKPLVLSAPHTNIARRITTLAQELVGGDVAASDNGAQPEGKGGLFGWKRGAKR